MPFTATLGAITFSGAADADGDRFTAESIDGVEFPDVSLSTEKAGPRGLYVARQRLDGRSLSIRGMGYQHGGALTEDRTWRIRRKLEQACLALVEASGLLVVNEPTVGRGAVQASVVMAEALRIRTAGPFAVEFEIGLLAPDPRLYATTLQQSTITNTTGVVTNGGTFRTPLTATLLATVTGPWVQNNSDGNKRVTLTGTIAAGAVIDFERRKVTSGAGANLYGSTAAGSKFFDLLVGANTIQTSGSWRIEWRNGWL